MNPSELGTQVVQEFHGIFEKAPDWLVRSPGRVNLIGEHTDYNGGLVFPFAIDKAIHMAARQTEGGESVLQALDFGETIRFSPTQLPAPTKGHWCNYLIGVMDQFRLRGLQLPSLEIAFSGDLPRGGGLSSSAALENAVAVLLNQLAGNPFERPELAKISQAAEHKYAGVRCGIMDQFVTLMGKTGQGLVLDCRTMEHRPAPLTLNSHHFVLCNSNVKHSLADSAYNTRREECESALTKLREIWPELPDLRAVTTNQLESSRSRLSDPEYRRALHQVEENRRVERTEQAFQANDLPLVGSLMSASHVSLDCNFEVSCPELNFLAIQFFSVLVIISHD